MNAANVRESVADERVNASRLLRIARALLALDGLPDAVNRAYYAMFYAVLALLGGCVEQGPTGLTGLVPGEEVGNGARERLVVVGDGDRHAPDTIDELISGSTTTLGSVAP